VQPPDRPAGSRGPPISVLTPALCNGAHALMFEGVPTYPDASRCWEYRRQHKVNNFPNTAPYRHPRALMAQGDELVPPRPRAAQPAAASVSVGRADQTRGLGVVTTT